MAAVREQLKTYINDELVKGGDVEVENVDILEEENVDSLGIFTLIGFIEEKFGVSIDPADINLDNFQTLDTITALVESRK